MKTTKTILTLLLLTIALSSCQNEPVDFNLTESSNNNKWWILKHRNYEDPGIYLYNETTATIELRLDLPESLYSPHAIAYDGKSLWVGGMGSNESIYQLNPQNGAIISEIKNSNTEGIASSGDYLYYGDYTTIKKIKKDGTFINEITTLNPTNVMPDLAIKGNDLYYLRYLDNDPVAKINLINNQESVVLNMSNIDSNCLTVSNNEIITINSFNEICHYDITTGAFISKKPTNMEGWITSITPYKVN